MIIKAYVRRNTYFDSITLMKVARTLTEMAGIEDAAAIMATEANLQLLAEAGLTPFEGEAGPADVLLVVRASDDSSAEAALQAAQEQFAHRPVVSSIQAEAGEQQQPRSLEQAVRLHADASIATISVPRAYSAVDPPQPLRSGLHVFLFRAKVLLQDEIPPKQL